ncbi:hypothetical protein R3W88_000121 [Solanum pinnatisectum]|uniref:Uncharacterized protein n=1 Tax=Solanum pinnatisectum TaxID=50273 RepID=A0AAV9MH43_9SOLN|nr:hypothetical protein R3W88_000121 [Solanum pinnatisectum]
MAIMKMLMMLVVAAIFFCSHHQVIMAKEVALVDEGSESLGSSTFDFLCQHLSWPYPWPQPCHPPRPRPRPRPCSPPPPPPRSSPPPASATTCSASDQQQVKTCMFETTSIDACCPIFRKILGTSCPCYKYAEDLDNQILITLEAYCDVSTRCKSVQVIKLSKNESR